MKKMLMTTAIALAAGSAAYADNHGEATDAEQPAVEQTTTEGATMAPEAGEETGMKDADGMGEMDMDRANLIRTRDITGGNVYAVDEDNFGVDVTYDTIDENWDVIGEIEDIVLDKNGQMIGIIAEVGGFLDIGDKHVFIEADQTRLVPVDDKTYGFVSPMKKDALMEKKDLDEGFWD